jgi:hypothetical protein
MLFIALVSQHYDHPNIVDEPTISEPEFFGNNTPTLPDNASTP